MSIFVFAIVICVIGTWLIRRSAAADDLRDTERTPVSPLPRKAGDDHVDGVAWTALDDHQLNRLLKDSSS